MKPLIPPCVSMFILRTCNMHCRFCYSTFREVEGRLDLEANRKVLRLLAEAGMQKVTFVGGEPTLHPDINDLIRSAHDLGVTTTIVTNGARLEKVLDISASYLDWVGLSLDSGDEAVEIALKRGRGGHVANTLRHARMCRAAGIRVKLNSVITALNWEEDMSDLVRKVNPDRWKAFQVLPVQGQNDGIEDLLITSAQFQAWVDRHRHLAGEGLAPVAEDNELMSDSYALVNPKGQFYTSNPGGHAYGPSILDVGVEAAWRAVTFRPERFEARGGRYDW